MIPAPAISPRTVAVWCRWRAREAEARAATIPHAAPDRLYRQLVLSTWRNRWLTAAKHYDGGSR